MKKCPKCGKTYDDSWEVCLLCTEKLLQLNEDTSKIIEEYKVVNKAADLLKLKMALSSLRRNLWIYAGGLIAIFVLWGFLGSENEILQNILVWAMGISVLVVFIWRIVMVFQIRYVYTSMNRGGGVIIIMQLLTWFIPLGAILIPLIVMAEARDMIKEMEGKKVSTGKK